MMWEEEIAQQGAPLNNKIFAQLRKSVKASRCDNSAQSLLFEIVALGRYIGPRLSKYAQTIQDKVDYHTYPSGHQVIKAFIGKDYVFCDNKKCILMDLTLDTIDKACTKQITWCIQKNIKTAKHSLLPQTLNTRKYVPFTACCALPCKHNVWVSCVVCGVQIKKRQDPLSHGQQDCQTPSARRP